MNSEILNQLTATFTAASDQFAFTSLRVWKENNEIRFFLSNLPPRHTRKNSSTHPSPGSSPKQDPHEQGEESDPQPATPTLHNMQTRGRPARKRRKPSTDRTPEIARSKETSQPNIDTSSLELERTLSIASIPCSNSFQALATLDIDDMSQDSTEDNLKDSNQDTSMNNTQDFIKDNIKDNNQDNIQLDSQVNAQDNPVYFGDDKLDSSGYPKAGLLKNSIFSTCANYKYGECELCTLHMNVKPLKFICKTKEIYPSDPHKPCHWHEQEDSCCVRYKYDFYQ